MFRPTLAPLTLFASLFALSLPVLAQNEPAGLQPLPEIPPPPGIEEFEEPQVTIVQRDSDTVTEYRVRGKLYMVKVTPLHGVPYYLIDREGKGEMVRDDSAPTLSVPMWVIKQW
ncbi:hypothetical protein AGMMS49543_13390 [Betaproteobacteria bacterium]|nr:hypothetical protein AGMMS49543_13390 [Betaproteobacteria bacterium]GHU10256.1 hypothetical protein AGMMS50225_13240 [Betaproteobacteria bacterium]GHU20727.1 hypothetical protein AGMMS50243_16350 [Betaproteobacteria bacterium]